MKTVISIILIGASIAFFVFFTKPKWTELNTNKMEVEKLNVAADNAKKLKARISDLEGVKNNISEADLGKIGRMLPDNVENVKLIIDFDNILQALVDEKGTAAIYKATENTDNTGKVSIENPKIVEGNTVVEGNFDSSRLGVANFTFTVSLTYADFIDFLKRIETSTRIFDVDSITFNTPTDAASIKDPNNIVYNFNVGLKTYWLKSK